MNKKKIISLMMAGIMMFSVTSCGGSEAPTEEPKDKPAAEEQVENTTYKSILADYTKRIKDATPGLIEEYNKEAQGINDINKLATISNKKVEKLAVICNKGVEEMAELMYKNGDKEKVYNDWATKLQKVYENQAMKITNAYMDSAM